MTIPNVADADDVAFAEDTVRFVSKRGKNGLHLIPDIDPETVEKYCNGYVASGPIPDDEKSQSLYIPDVTGLAPLPSALAYAEAGGWTVPVRKGTKNPGSLVGEKWQDHASRDPEQIQRWWTKWPDADIALVAGASGVVVFDLDQDSADALPAPAWTALQTGKVQLTRESGSVRGHYVFACQPDSFSNASGGFMRYGEVRCKNGVIIVEPSTHAKADEGGRYRWDSHGEVPELPHLLRDLLTKSLPGDEHADPKTLAELKSFLADHDGEDRPAALKGQLTAFATDTAAGASRHESMCRALVWAFREAMAGCYPAQRAYDELRAAFEVAKPESVGNGEFDRMACWAAAQAELADVSETLARLNRNVWPGPDTPLLVAKRVAELAEAGGGPLKRWRGGWHLWDGSSWPEIPEEALRAELYELLANAEYLKTVKIPQTRVGSLWTFSRGSDALSCGVGCG